jgi:hypothetical protein
MTRDHLLVPAFFPALLLCTALIFCRPAPCSADEEPAAFGASGSSTCKIPFFDGIKLQTTNSQPKLTNANHVIRDINRFTGSDLKDWDTMTIQTIDIVLWKDLSKYFKADFALAGSTGSLISSSTGFQQTPLDVAIRMRQRYSAVELWSNLYFYPLTTDYKDQYSSGRIIEPFIAVGLGYTFFRSETAFKVRKGGYLYDRAQSNWSKSEWGYKMMTGFNVNLGNITPQMNRWVVTVSAFQIWNRLKGNAKLHLTDELKIGGGRIPVDITARQRMDIDLSGPCFSIAVGRYF